MGILPPILAGGVYATTANPQAMQKFDPDAHPWSAMFFYGITASQTLGKLLQGECTKTGEIVYNVEGAYTLSRENLLSKFLKPVVGAIQIAGLVGQRNEHRDSPLINECELYFMLRWLDFPWNKTLATTFAAGEGISYVSRIPYVEVSDPTADGSRRWLNYLVFEATFAVPTHPEWQLVARIHHRSTAYGVFGNTNGGSNTLGLAIRYRF